MAKDVDNLNDSIRKANLGLSSLGISSPLKELSQQQPGSASDERYNLTDRYSSDRAAISNAFNLPAPDEGNVREQYRQQAQALINQVNTKYAAIEAEDRATVDLMNRERRAGNVLNGLSGSSAGAAKTVQTAQEGAKLQKMTADQKAADISAILANAETRGTEEFNRQREAYIAQAKDKYTAEQSLNERIRTDAQNELAQIASSMNYDDFAKQKPELLQQYMNETGLSELGIKAAFLNASKDRLLSPDPKIVGNKAIWFSQNPDGSISQTELDLPDVGKEIQDSRITDAGIQVLYSDGTYEVLGGGISGGGGGTRLSVTEAQALGVPYGTTEEEAVQMGITPKKAPTEGQSRDNIFANRLEDADGILGKNEADILKMSPIAFSASGVAESTTIGNSSVSDAFRQQRQAERNFLNAVLRRESGAVISPTEFAEGARQYFPRPGDDAKTLAQKKRNREVVVATMKKSAGSGYERVALEGGDDIDSFLNSI